MGGWFRHSSTFLRSRKILKLGKGEEGRRNVVLFMAILELNVNQDRDGLLSQDDLDPEMLAFDLAWYGLEPEEVERGLQRMLSAGLLAEIPEGICIPGWLEYRPQLTDGQKKAVRDAIKAGRNPPYLEEPAWAESFRHHNGAGPAAGRSDSVRVTDPLRQGDGKVTDPLRQGDGKVTERVRQGGGRVTESLRQGDGQRDRGIDREEGGERAKRTLSPTDDRTVPGSSSVGPDPAGGRAAPSDSPGRNGKPPGTNGQVAESWKARLKRVAVKHPDAAELFEQLLAETAWTKSRDGHQAIDVALAMVQEGWSPQDWRDFLDRVPNHSGSKRDTLAWRRDDLASPRRRQAILTQMRQAKADRERARGRGSDHLWGHMQLELEDDAAMLAKNSGGDQAEILKRLIAERYRLMLMNGERVPDGTELGHMLTLEEIPEDYRAFLPAKIPGSKPIPAALPVPEPEVVS